MTKKEFDELNGTAYDKLGEELHVGDTVIGPAYPNTVEVYKILRIMPKMVKVIRDRNGYCSLTDNMHSYKLIKVKSR